MQNIHHNHAHRQTFMLQNIHLVSKSYKMVFSALNYIILYVIYHSTDAIQQTPLYIMETKITHHSLVLHATNSLAPLSRLLMVEAEVDAEYALVTTRENNVTSCNTILTTNPHSKHSPSINN